MTPTRESVLTEKRSPAYWRVTLDNPPINLFDPEMIEGFTALITELEADDEVKVVVFESADPDFFMAHFDLVRATEVDLTPGPTGLAPWPDAALRFERAPFITIASVRGRARGVGSEFIQAMDLCFASRERAILQQPEVPMGFIPGGGGMERLYRRVGRSRALEIIVGGEDFDADTAERYGWINRAIADADLDGFVDGFASRIAGFDRDAIATAKEILRNHAGVPTPADLRASEERFYDLLARPGAQSRVSSLLQRGLQTPGDLELNLAKHL